MCSTRLMVLTFLFAVSSTVAFSGDIQLPPPQKTGGPPLFACFENRRSAGQSTFPSGEVSREDLSTILWAASGLNRQGSKWTVPMAMGRPPYCKIYVTSKDGIHLYNWKEHKLEEISGENVNADIPTQYFAQRAPLSLYFVTDGESISAMDEPLASEGGPLLAGAMSQHVYLACEALGIGTRMIYSIKRDAASRLFKLGENDVVLFAMPMGKE